MGRRSATAAARKPTKVSPAPVVSTTRTSGTPARDGAPSAAIAKAPRAPCVSTTAPPPSRRKRRRGSLFVAGNANQIGRSPRLMLVSDEHVRGRGELAYIRASETRWRGGKVPDDAGAVGPRPPGEREQLGKGTSICKTTISS